MTPDRLLPIGEHLEELRSRLIVAVVFTVLACAVCFYFQRPLMARLVRPHLSAMEGQPSGSPSTVPAELEAIAAELEGKSTGERSSDALNARALRRIASGMKGTRLQVLRYEDAFLSYFKVSVWVALFVSAPVILFQLWSFVRVGLRENERRIAARLAPVSLLLFAAGAAFGYFLLVPWALYFLAIYGDPELIVPAYTLGDYLSLLTGLTLALGLIFQLPLVMILLKLLDVLRVETMSRYRRHWIAASFFLAAVLPTTDLISQTLIAGVLILLYEVGILACKSLRPSARSTSA